MNQLKSKLEEIETDYCYYRFISKREPNQGGTQVEQNIVETKLNS